MTFRTIVALLAVVAIAACGGAATEEEVEVVQESPLDDAAAVAAMIDDIGYDVDHNYIAGTVEIFGQFDADGNGSLNLNEYEAFGWAPCANA